MIFPEWSKIRVATLLAFLILSLLYSSYQLIYSRNWGAPLDVVVFPIAATDTRDVQRYIEGLEESDFEAIDKWMSAQARAHGLPNPQPVSMRLGSQIDVLPPAFPEEPNPGSILLWGLRMRWWSAFNTPDEPGLSWRSVKIICGVSPW